MVLTITANGTSSSSETYQLPAASWSGDATKGYKYKDAAGANGPVKVAKIKKSAGGVFQIKAVISGKIGPISVVPPNDGTSACASTRPAPRVLGRVQRVTRGRAARGEGRGASSGLCFQR